MHHIEDYINSDLIKEKKNIPKLNPTWKRKEVVWFRHHGLCERFRAFLYGY